MPVTERSCSGLWFAAKYKRSIQQILYSFAHALGIQAYRVIQGSSAVDTERLPSLFQISPKLGGYSTTLLGQLEPWFQMLRSIRLLEICPPDQL